MILSRRVALNGTYLDTLDNHIVIRSVDPGVPHEEVTSENLMGGFGQRVTGQHWQSIDVAVSFAIDIPRKQLAARKEVFDKAVQWALGRGWLTVNYIAGRKLWVDKVVIPGSGDLWAWTNEYTITFRAYGVPFWQDDTATVTEIAEEDGGAGEITVPGMLTTVCDAEIENVSGETIDSLSVTVGSSTFSFTSLGLSDGDRLVIGHGDDGQLYIRKYTGESYYVRAMDKRSGASADDLYAEPGDNAITITGGAVEATVSCFGRYV